MSIKMGTEISSECKECGERFAYIVPRRGRRRLFCGRSCQCKDSRRRRGAKSWTSEGRCLKCGTPYIGSRGSKFCSEGCRDTAITLLCECCKKPFARSNEQRNARFCSQRCLHRVKDPIKRAQRLAVHVEDVSRDTLYLRDGGTCGLCKEPVDDSLAWPHPESPTIDHVIPISRGGEHSYANTQLAHLWCNLSKNNRCDPVPSQSPPD